MTKSSLVFQPPVLAHRGASAVAPENTLAAFRKAKELGARWLEFDVMLAACGEVVVFHDDTLDRTTNGHGMLHDYPYSELSKLDAGSWFDARFAGERIPRFSEVLEFLQREQLAANIEIKPLQGLEAETIERVLAQVAKYPTLPTPLFSSFSIPALKELRKQAPACQLGLLLDELDPSWETLCRELQATTLNLNEMLLTPPVIATLQTAGLPLLAYTVNDPQRARELFSAGVIAVFSDSPEKIR